VLIVGDISISSLISDSIVGDISISNSISDVSLLAFQEAFEYRFYYTDTLFALVKPIHKTPLPMITLTISVNLFETGIKVVDLLTPYET
jgi:hypothetical protein